MSIRVQTFIPGFARAFAISDDSTGQTILVDAGLKENTRSLSKNLSRIGVSPHTVSMIVLTHAHSDHTRPLPDLKKLTRAPLMSSVPAAEALAAGRDEELVPRTAFGRCITRISQSGSSDTQPGIPVEYVIRKETDLAPYGVDATVLPTPGHTTGSLSVLTADSHAVIGDLLMKFLPGRPGLSFLSNNVDELTDSLQNLLDRGAHTFHLAHGGVINRRAVESILNRSK